MEPPGQARSDLAIWLDFARRMDSRDNDGAPLVPWEGAESAYRAWRRCSEGRPCVPFHYGYWDARDGAHQRAADELTITGWAPVSTQPLLEAGAVSPRKVP